MCGILSPFPSLGFANFSNIHGIERLAFEFVESSGPSLSGFCKLQQQSMELNVDMPMEPHQSDLQSHSNVEKTIKLSRKPSKSPVGRSDIDVERKSKKDDTKRRSKSVIEFPREAGVDRQAKNQVPFAGQSKRPSIKTGLTRKSLMKEADFNSTIQSSKDETSSSEMSQPTIRPEFNLLKSSILIKMNPSPRLQNTERSKDQVPSAIPQQENSELSQEVKNDKILLSETVRRNERSNSPGDTTGGPCALILDKSKEHKSEDLSNSTPNQEIQNQGRGELSAGLTSPNSQHDLPELGTNSCTEPMSTSSTEPRKDASAAGLGVSSDTLQMELLAINCESVSTFSAESQFILKKEHVPDSESKHISQGIISSKVSDDMNDSRISLDSSFKHKSEVVPSHEVQSGFAEHEFDTPNISMPFAGDPLLQNSACGKDAIEDPSVSILQMQVKPESSRVIAINHNLEEPSSIISDGPGDSPTVEKKSPYACAQLFCTEFSSAGIPCAGGPCIGGTWAPSPIKAQLLPKLSLSVAVVEPVHNSTNNDQSESTKFFHFMDNKLEPTSKKGLSWNELKRVIEPQGPGATVNCLQYRKSRLATSNNTLLQLTNYADFEDRESWKSVSSSSWIMQSLRHHGSMVVWRPDCPLAQHTQWDRGCSRHYLQGIMQAKVRKVGPMDIVTRETGARKLACRDRLVVRLTEPEKVG